MCKQLGLEEVCSYVLRQVPEADPADVARYALDHMRFPCSPSDAYSFARFMEAFLIQEGVV